MKLTLVGTKSEIVDFLTAIRSEKPKMSKSELTCAILEDSPFHPSCRRATSGETENQGGSIQP